MSLRQKLQDDMKTALKAGQKDRLSVIRMLLSDVNNVDLAAKPTTEEEAVAAYAKKLRKSLEEYEKLGKTAEVEHLRFELAVADEYLPKKASSEQTEQMVDAFLAAHTFTEKQFGQAMGAFMKSHGPEIDPATVNALLRRKLAGK